MRTLQEVTNFIISRPARIPFIALGSADWESVRDEAIDADEFYGDPRWSCPNFIVMGVPILKGGEA